MTVQASRVRRVHGGRRLRWGLALWIALWVSLFADSAAGSASRSVLVVPSAYPTIQAAVDAAKPGDTIKVLPGTYVEQVTIHKALEIRGAGRGVTIIRAPRTLVPGRDGTNSIVEIFGRASVGLARLTVRGPGSGTCDHGALGSGIRVLGGAHLNLDRSGVVQITDTPTAPCFHSGNGILVGNFPVGTGSATIRHSFIGGYQGAGIVVLNEGSTARILHNVVQGPGFSAGVSTDGIELVVGASGNVSHNVVSGNVCVRGDPDCGRNFFEQLQHAGIVGGVAGKRTVISRNVVRHNQVGIYAAEAASIWRNVAVDNGYFGMALQDGFFRLTHDRVSGGHGGVAVIAAFADTVAVLRHITITRTAGAPVQRIACCGFTARTIGWP